MNSQETFTHIELKLTQLIMITEKLKYYILFNHNKIETILNEFTTLLIEESHWMTSQLSNQFKSTDPNLNNYKNLITFLNEHPFNITKNGDSCQTINHYQLMIFDSLTYYKYYTN
ncbi:hypothetical protein [Staphylococcus pasteuri]|uniref:hypothetical protein n=1 Tax=Staphylococcus pasteuri TaxID=45972 RepID=UPI000E69186B|nr:hypothetical protein [Staphylococcus pasteuri]MCT1926636.1 hypothetical protein [Staphylococcus pasteuri]QQT12058.1 hypothetical protein I6J09_04990 [Staphylococcus pasteuri]RIO53727.1 hypothetical protein BUZ64_04690 [Staphylococcus pasteuri]